MDLWNDLLHILGVSDNGVQKMGDKNKSNSKEMFYAKMIIQKISENGDVREYWALILGHP